MRRRYILLAGVLLMPLFVTPVLLTAKEKVPDTTQFSESTLSQAAISQAKSWDLLPKDWMDYQTLMQGPRGLWSPDLDPITVLGIHAKTASEREHYARKLVKIERQRVEQELAFEAAYQAAQAQLFGDIPLYRQGPAPAGGYGEAKSTQTVDFFLKLPCKVCEPKLSALIEAGVTVNIYFVGATAKTIKKWAVTMKISPARVSSKQVTLNLDNGLSLSRGITKLPYMVER